MNEYVDANAIAKSGGSNLLRDSIDNGIPLDAVNKMPTPLESQKREEEWPTPKALPNGLLPVPAFRLEYLPGSVAKFVGDISDRMQCPPDFVGIAAIVALGAVLGRKIGIRPQHETTWTEVPNCWGCIIGAPGAMKSPAIGEVLKPLKRLEGAARKANAEAFKNYDLAKQEHKIRKAAAEKRAGKALENGKDIPKGLLSLNEPEKPKARRYIVNDATYEALGEILADNPNGVLVHRDEVVSLLKTLDREECAAARGFFLTAWNGNEAYTFDRIMRGKTHLEAACVSLLGTTQPSKIAEYIRRAIFGGGGDDGLIQRFGLMVWPDQSTDYREVDRHSNVSALDAAESAFQRLDKLNPTAAGAQQDRIEEIPFLRFDSAALRRFQDFRAVLERKVRKGDLHPALESHLAKYRKLIPSLALINHLSDSGEGAVSDEGLGRAIEFSNYLEAHARRVYGARAQAEVAAAAAIMKRVKSGDIVDGFTARDVYQREWSNLSNREQVQAGLELLAEHDWLDDRPVQTGGRKKTLYYINPRARR